MRLQYRARARDDIADIYQYRATEHDPQVAARIERAIRDTAAMLAVHPQFGSHTDHHHDVRRWPMTQYAYTFFYRVDFAIATITILRVIDSRRVRDLSRVPGW
jgi:plasmid stabilization system protein ParE